MAVRPRRLLQHVRRFVSVAASDSDSDAGLLERFVRDRDEDAFAALVARHGPMVLGVCRRLVGDCHAAEDAFQAVFVVLARKAGSIRPRHALAAWLYGVARRVALKAQAAARRRRPGDDATDVSAALDPRPDPLDQLSARELLAVIDQEIGRLPQAERLPILLCCIEGKSQEEAARQLGWTAGSLRGRLERGRTRLHDRLTRRGLTLSAALAACRVGAAGVAPMLLAGQTVHAALAFTSDVASSNLPISPHVALLVNGALKEMAMTKSKTASALLLAGLVLTGAAFAVSQALNERQSEKPGAVVERAAEEKQDDKPAARVDEHGDPLPPDAIARFGTLRFRVPATADAIAFSPDSKLVAVSSPGGLYVFETDSGKRIKRLGDSGGAGRMKDALAFSPDGERVLGWGLISVSDGKGSLRTSRPIRLWDIHGDQDPQDYDGVQHVAWLGWSPKGQPSAVCFEKGGVVLRELATAKSRRFECANITRPHLSEHVAMACVLAGQRLAVTDEKGVIHIWDTSTGAEVCTVAPEQGHYVRSLALSPNGRTLATLQQERADFDTYAIHLWSAETGEPLNTMTPKQKYITTIAFCPDGKTLVSAGYTGTSFWDLSTGRERSRSEGEGSNTEGIAISGDSRALATLQTHTGAVHLWDVATGKRKSTPAGHSGSPWGITFTRDGRRMASGGSLDGTIHVWDFASRKSLFSIDGGTWGRRVHLSHDGSQIYSSWANNQLWISDAADGAKQHVIKLEDSERLDSEQSAVSSHLSTDGKILVAFSHYYPKKDGGPKYDEVLLTGVDPTTRKPLFQRRILDSSWNAVSADGRLRASAHAGETTDFGERSHGDGPMRLEVLATGERLLTFPKLEGQTLPIEFSPDCRLLASNNSNPARRKAKGVSDPDDTGSNLVLWEVATASEVLSLPWQAQYRVAFSPNGRLLALTQPKNEILVWDLANGRELRRFKHGDAGLSSLAFTPDGRGLVSGLTDSTILLWDIPTPAAAAVKLEAADAAQTWKDLAAHEAPKALRARWKLVNSPAAAFALCKQHLKPAQAADAERLRAVIADLDSSEFAVRDAATKQLEELGDLAAGALRQTTETKSLELKRRAQALLDKLRGPITRPDVLQALRAVAVLEDIGDLEARKLLEGLAQGAPDARVTQEARAAMERLRLATRPGN